MGVQFDQGSFTVTDASGSSSTKLTEFTLDRRVDIFIDIEVDENDGEFLVYIVQPQTTGQVVLVQGSAPINVSGFSLRIPFGGIPAGYYQAVIIPLGGGVNASGSWKASWENIAEDVGDGGESLPVSLPEEPQLLEIDIVPENPDAPVVQWVEVDTIAQDN